MSSIKRRPVEVVDCGDPWAGKAKKPRPSDDASTVRGNSNLGKSQGGDKGYQKSKGRGRGYLLSTNKEFVINDALRDVADLGATQFEAWQRKQFEQSKLEDLGARAAANRKMPLKMLQGIRAKREKVAESREAEARAAGIVVARKQRVEYGTGMKQGKGRSKDDSGPGIGESIVRGGMLTVPRAMLESMGVSARSKRPKQGGKGSGKGSKGGGKGKGGGGKGKGKKSGSKPTWGGN